MKLIYYGIKFLQYSSAKNVSGPNCLFRLQGDKESNSVNAQTKHACLARLKTIAGTNYSPLIRIFSISDRHTL